jgi:plastocyanin
VGSRRPGACGRPAPGRLRHEHAEHERCSCSAGGIIERGVVHHHLELHVHADVAQRQSGATVTVTNKDSATHTLTATDGQFSTGSITHDQSKTFKAPRKSGTYHYICSIHQFMMGTIVVR